MDTPDTVKERLQRLYEKDPHIHITMIMPRAKISVKNAPVVITGIYRHIFQVEQTDAPRPTRYSVQYAELLNGQVQIPELGPIIVKKQ